MTAKMAILLAFLATLLVPLLLSCPADGRILVLRSNESYFDRLAAFGPRIDEESFVEGILIPVESLAVVKPHAVRDAATEYNISINDPATAGPPPQQGCLPVYPPQGLPANASWIALVERGYCAFIDKVRLMQQSGAVAVVVGDNEKSAGLITMFASGDTRDIRIPSVFIAQWEYRDLRSQSLPLINNNRNSRHLNNSSGYSTEFLWIRLLPSEEWQWPLLDIIVITIVSPTILLLVLYFLWRFRRRSGNNGALNGGAGYQMGSDNILLTADELSRLPLLVYDDDSRPLAEEPDVCVVCLEWIEEGQQVRVLPHCGHLFHSHCIDPWLTCRKRYCPICKRDALPSTLHSTASTGGDNPPDNSNNINTNSNSNNNNNSPNETTPLLLAPDRSIINHVSIDIPPPQSSSTTTASAIILERLSSSFRSHGTPQTLGLGNDSDGPVNNTIDTVTQSAAATTNRQPSVRRWRPFRPRRHQTNSAAAESTAAADDSVNEEGPAIPRRSGLMRLFGLNSHVTPNYSFMLTTACCGGHLDSTTADAVPLRGEVIELPEDAADKLGTLSPIKAYVTLPDHSGEMKDWTGGVVLLLTDVFGLPLHNSKLYADLMCAETGMPVIVPDLFNGDPMPIDRIIVPDSVQLKPLPVWRQLGVLARFLPWILRHSPAKGEVLAVRALHSIRRHLFPQAVRCGLIGFCYGGGQAMRLMRRKSDSDLIDAAVLAHPAFVAVPADIMAVTDKPMTLILAEYDNQIKRQHYDRLMAALGKENGQRRSVVDVKWYPGTQHGFAIRGWRSDPVVAKARQEAFEQAAKFLEQYLLTK